MTPLFNDADQNLLRALPNETRKAVVELHARGRKRGIADAAEAIRSVARDPRHGTMRVVYQSIADVLQRHSETPLELNLPDVPTPDPTTLSDNEILDLPPLDRAKVLADIAAQGLILAVMLVDVVKMDPAPATDPDAFPWDAPSPEAEDARDALDRGHTPGHG
jgi:hypothetical protein